MEEQNIVSSKESIFSHYPEFSDTEKGKQAIKDNKNEFQKSKTGRLLSILLIVVSLLLIFFLGQFLWGIVLFVCGVFGFAAQRNREQRANNNYYNSISQYTNDIANSLVRERFDFSQGITSHDFGFVYNADYCAYFSIVTGDLVIYSKEDIKEVQKERVLVSSTATSVSTGNSRNTLGTTLGINPMDTRKVNVTTNTNSINNYEWHLDIYSKFMECPRISMTFKENETTENMINEAYAFLLP